ncbi:CHC2 zinc finger domain-containing protein [Inquilinus sp.]|jgi:hypothetical protein|uniref:CHC2 zinc finger domain-containing protein n=1 Tax=Inquilinus sp. TaxID=1932117 RepID=UPI00378384E5
MSEIENLSPDWIRDVLSRVRKANTDRADVAPHHRFGNVVALCPFHEERTPSFLVNGVTGAYHCLSCGIRGSMEVLAKAAGVPMPAGFSRKRVMTNFRFGEIVGAMANALHAYSAEERAELLERWHEAGRALPVAIDIVAEVRAGIGYSGRSIPRAGRA